MLIPGQAGGAFPGNSISLAPVYPQYVRAILLALLGQICVLCSKYGHSQNWTSTWVCSTRTLTILWYPAGLALILVEALECVTAGVLNCFQLVTEL